MGSRLVLSKGQKFIRPILVIVSAVMSAKLLSCGRTSAISPHIVFAHRFYASALNEISHWCIAGKECRKWVDFGYLYCPRTRRADPKSI